MTFKLKSEFKPAGDQPKAIDQLTTGLTNGQKDQILLGVTGSGKTYTIANVIQNVQRPAIVLAHNKTLAAQLCAEFREFFPENAVDYFVSYYDYYQPEAYIAARDVYIEKESDVNEEIERLRHHATRALHRQRDVIIVASVSCIYGLGSPGEYNEAVLDLSVGDEIKRKSLLEQLHQIQYERNDTELTKGKYRVKGDVIDIYPVWDNYLIRLDFFGDEIEAITLIHHISGEVIDQPKTVEIYPATHYVVGTNMEPVINRINEELDGRLKELIDDDKPLEAKRLEQRTKFDIEMIRELGYCKGIENYSRLIENRPPHSAPDVLLDFFPDDFITIIDESHATLPQVKGMYNGDRARKKALIDHGFRLPSAYDNRPLNFQEFEKKIGQTIYVSATPGPYELELCRTSGTPRKTMMDINKPKKQEKQPRINLKEFDIVEQIIRPTGLVDPHIEVRPTKHQIDDIITEVQKRVKQKERVLITALTKKMSEELTTFLEDKGIRVRYLHSEVKAMDRLDILHDLRAGVFDVLVGVNLLREGLDLPEVSLVVILDADKEGFLRNERSLIQTMGRAARNVNGTVLLYADKITDSMNAAMSETNRRRDIQLAHNKKHNIQPKTIIKKVTDIRQSEREAIQKLTEIKTPENPNDLPKLIMKLEREMNAAAKRLEFEVAAVLRDQLAQLKDNGV